MPCIACQTEGAEQPLPTEAHHLVDRGYRKHSGGHDATIPLCSYHHRGVPIEGWKADEMLYHFGPSLALHKRRFVDTYGSERTLLAAINDGLT